MLPLAHLSPNPKRHLDRFSRFCTAHSRVAILYKLQRAAPFPLNIPIPTEDLDPHLIRYIIPWAHPSPQPKRHFDRFSRFAGLTTVTDRSTDRQTTLLGL